MKKPFVLACLAWTCLHLSAQIIVPASTFPVPGDTLRYAKAGNPNVAIALYTPPGGAQFWDLSGLTTASTYEERYRNATEGVYKDHFPGAGTVLTLVPGGDEHFNASTTTKFQWLGYGGDSVGGLPLTAVYQHAPVLAVRHAPLQFFDIYQGSTGNLLAWSYAEIPPGAIMLPVTPDSVRIRIAINALDVVDAWGTLRLPGLLSASDFFVLRLKRTSYKEQRVDAKIPPLGWLDVTDQVIQSGSPWAPLFGVDTVVTHHFFNDVHKEAIAVLTFNTDQNAVVDVVFKNMQPATSPVSETPDAASLRLKLYPNPATSAVSIGCAGAPPGAYTLKLFDGSGKLLWESACVLDGNAAVVVALPDGVRGLVWCRLEDARGKLVGMGRLVVER